MGFDVPARLAALTRGLGPGEVRRRLAERPLTTSSDVYRRWSARAFALLDRVEHRNLSPGLPPCAFSAMRPLQGVVSRMTGSTCNYWDDDHPSVLGGRLIVDRILGAVRRAESMIRAAAPVR